MLEFRERKRKYRAISLYADIMPYNKTNQGKITQKKVLVKLFLFVVIYFYVEHLFVARRVGQKEKEDSYD